MKPLVMYHDHCTDGYGAAFAAWIALGDTADYLPVNYGHKWHPADLRELVDGREVYVLDFSLPRPAMEQLFNDAKQVVWLDHHKTAFEMWCGQYNRGEVFLDFTNGHAIKLDDNKSGALLAWEYFHPLDPTPDMFLLIDDRDRWQFKYEGSREFHAAMGSTRPWTFRGWQSVLDQEEAGELGLWMEMGAGILRAMQQNVEQMAEAAQKCVIDGKEGLAVNASLHQSELGNLLSAKSGTYALVWYVAKDGKVRCSLRSKGDYDVSGMAREFGGGGHMNAAGFETDIGALVGFLK